MTDLTNYNKFSSLEAFTRLNDATKQFDKINNYILNNINAYNRNTREIVEWLENNTFLVGSRFFGTQKPDSDYDFLVNDSEETIKKLESMDFRKIIDNVHKATDRIHDGDYSDTFTSYVYEKLIYDFNTMSIIKIHVQCSNNVELKYKIYQVLKRLNIFSYMSKQEKVRYFISFCNAVKVGAINIFEMVKTFNQSETDNSDKDSL